MYVPQIIDLAAIAVTVFFFGLGSYFDLKTREVDDRVWLIYGPIGCALTALRLLIDPSVLMITLISIAITALASFGLFYFGLFGGADFKAIICLGLTLPLPPTVLQPLIGYVHPVFPLVVIIIGFICSASAGVWVGLGNLLTYAREGRRMFEGLEHEALGRKALAMILGYRTEISKLRSTLSLYPMEQIVKDNDGMHRSLRLYVNAEMDRDQAASEFCDLAGKMGYQGKVWVTPGLPMLVFLLIGFGITLVLGDAIFASVLLLARR